MLLSAIAGQEKVEHKPSLLPCRHCLHFVDRVTYSAELHQLGFQDSGSAETRTPGP